MSDQHLGEEVHDLLDNRLNATRSASAMRHLGLCADCRMRWDDLRKAREALQTSSAGIDMTFSQELLNRERIAEIARSESKHKARAARGRGRRPVLSLLIVFVVLSTGVGVSYAAGAPAEVSLEFAHEPAGGSRAAQASVQLASGAPYGSSEATYMGPDTMRGGDSLRSWVHPDWDTSGVTPVEAAVIHTRNGDPVLVASVLYRLEPVVITEQHGQLPASLAHHAESIDLGSTRAYIVNDWPRQLVWQTGDVVISATCSCPLATLEAVAKCFPTHEDPNFVNRVVNGFRELTGFSSK